MKIAIIDTYYKKFLRHHYNSNLHLSDKNYTQQLTSIISARFGTSDFYSYNLSKIGVEAVDLIANCEALQHQWAIENRFKYNKLWSDVPSQALRLPFIGKILQKLPNILDILSEQINKIKPDIIYCQDINFVPPDFLHSIKSHCKLLVGQIASPLPPDSFIRPFDLILTSFPHFIPRLQAKGVNSEYFRIGFDPRVLDSVGGLKKIYPITFVGGISRHHTKAIPLLEHLAHHTDIQFYGYGAASLPRESIIRSRHKGEVWGLDMYSTLAKSHLTINRHIDTAENFANNMRLFEATGVGATLLTDQKDNLNQLFQIGREVISYSSPEEAVELIRYYSDHRNESADIGKAGQARTLREHTYLERMRELADILRRRLP